MSRPRKPAKPEPPPPPAAAAATPCGSFVDTFMADWRENGPATIVTLRTEKPTDDVRIAASLFAKEANQEIDPLHDLTDAELADRIDTIAASLGLEIRPRTPARRAGEADDAPAHGATRHPDMDTSKAGFTGGIHI